MEVILRRQKSGIIAIGPLILAFTQEIFKIQCVLYLMVLKSNKV